MVYVLFNKIFNEMHFHIPEDRSIARIFKMFHYALLIQSCKDLFLKDQYIFRICKIYERCDDGMTDFSCKCE